MTKSTTFTVSISILLTTLLFVPTTTGAFNKTKHHTYEEMLDIMAQTKQKCPQITHLYNLTGGPNATLQGRRLAVIVFSEHPENHTRGIPEFKYVGNMHGNEVVGKELLLRLMEHLCDEYNSGNQVVRELLRTTRIHLLPSMNPDGWQAAYEDFLKGGRGHEDLLGRGNSENVDLNRNFPDLDTLFFNSTTPNHHLMSTFVGERMEEGAVEGGKEWAAETMMVMKWVIETPFVLSANLHGGELVVNYPFDTSPFSSRKQYSPTPDDSLFRHLALTYAQKHKVMKIPQPVCERGGRPFYEQGGITNGAEWYKVDGGMQDFNYLASNCFELTVELGCDKFPPPSHLPQYWAHNKEALISFMWLTHVGVKGLVVDDVTNQGIEAAVVAVSCGNGSHINHDVTTAKGGDYWRLLEDGFYTIKVCAEPLYQCQEKSIRLRNAPYEEAKVVNFRLSRKQDVNIRSQQEELNELTEWENVLKRFYAV